MLVICYKLKTTENVIMWESYSDIICIYTTTKTIVYGKITKFSHKWPIKEYLVPLYLFAYWYTNKKLEVMASILKLHLLSFGFHTYRILTYVYVLTCHSKVQHCSAPQHTFPKTLKRFWKKNEVWCGYMPLGRLLHRYESCMCRSIYLKKLV